VPPLGGTPRLPALHGRLPRKGASAAGPRRRFRRTVHQTPPLARQAGDRAPRGTRSGRPLPAFAGCWIDPDATGFRHLRQLSDPPLREGRADGGPPCRQVGRLSWVFVPCRLGSKVRAEGAVRLAGQRLIRSSGYPYDRFASDVTPRHRDAPTPTFTLRGSRREEPPRLSPWVDRLSLSRARRTFVRRGVLRVVSFR